MATRLPSLNDKAPSLEKARWSLNFIQLNQCSRDLPTRATQSRQAGSMRASGIYILLLAGCLCCTGCLSLRSIDPQRYPPLPGKDTNSTAFIDAVALDGTWHSFRVKPGANLNIRTCQKFNPVWWLGNADEPVPPSWYRPNSRMRTFLWHLRNPLHNLNNYVLGIHDKESVRSGRYPRGLSKPKGGWNFAVSKQSHLRLPFVDYRRGKFEFYFGWRIGGNFGVKMNWHDDGEKTRPAPVPNGHN
jgi:hypothetical protein